MLGFSVGDLHEMETVAGAYKKAIETAEPIGAFVNDNIMVTTAAFVKESHAHAVHSAAGARTNYFQSQVVPLSRHLPAPRRCALLARGAA